MIETLADLTIHYGAVLIFFATFASCLAIPVPTSLIMLSAGAFAAGGDLTLFTVAASALAGALAGDQTGFALGRRFTGILDRATGKTAKTIEKARRFSQQRGGLGVFFSRWLFSPLGPYVNYIAGATGMVWPRFSLWSLMGEIIWVTIYVGAGYLFADQIEGVATLLSNASGAAAGLAITVILGLWLWRQSAPRRT
ncbi:DedA family protein [Oceaniglobus ichthyenteri]|uniref:DedA family protein n=1 Tax=Oceaniglobus ichthyenteri TaxID=2136177 RepID=UPI000D3C3BE0|nr:VTT domain-containing protein [Oceaniglobus ichthyenteri]